MPAGVRDWAGIVWLALPPPQLESMPTETIPRIAIRSTRDLPQKRRGMWMRNNAAREAAEKMRPKLSKARR